MPSETSWTASSTGYPMSATIRPPAVQSAVDEMADDLSHRPQTIPA
jgi:hypothetical protein